MLKTNTISSEARTISSEAKTIRGLLVECTKAHGEIRRLLELNFSRQPEEEGKCADIPSYSNVLDEVIDGLANLLIEQSKTTDFIVKEITSKL